MDSCPIPAPLRENNLKTAVRDRFNKNRPPKGDPDSRLGAYRIYPGAGSQKIRYFWGYRNHIAVDFETGITYRQYCCPLHCRKNMLQRFLLCPANHPRFLTQKGCNYLRRETPSYRSQVACGSSKFTDLYKRRTSVERVFSRLLSMAMQRPTVVGLDAVRNSCTVAHITVLLVALAAHEQGHADKLAFVRSYVPNFMSER
jgi:hypothetical protein